MWSINRIGSAAGVPRVQMHFAIVLIADCAGGTGDTGIFCLKTAVRHNARVMRHFFALSLLAVLGTTASAEVVRCTDAAGKVSYTDGACAAGTRQVAKVDVPEVVPPTREELEQRRQAQIDSVNRANQMQREAAEAALREPQPSGPVIIDSRGNNGNGNARAPDSRWSDRRDDAVFDGGPGYYDPYGGGYRPPPPARDMRPRIRNCGPAGCTDTQGNSYNRGGQLDRYRSLDGKTCRPVGTTTVCQ